MKIYTKQGDTGKTSLFSGEKVDKNHALIMAYGTVDELNSILGVSYSIEAIEVDRIQKIQHQLFQLGADLATPLSASKETQAHIQRISEKEVAELERQIDEMQSELPPLTNFILPGGSPASSQLHHARCVCRRAERLTIESLHKQKINPLTTVYLNRLSDYLFVLARYVNQKAGQKDIIWEKL